jgi:hypothetical protein
VLHPAEHVLVELGSRVEIIEILYLVAVLEVLCAMWGMMAANNNELLAFVLGKLSLKQQLFLGKLKGLTDTSLTVDAGQIE